MTDDPTRNPAPAAGQRVPVTQTEAAPPATLDANGFDPAEFGWRPVPRRPRIDGWTPEVQRRFIEALARSGGRHRHGRGPAPRRTRAVQGPDRVGD